MLVCTLVKEGNLTCNVDINKPAASTATYLPASLAVRKGVMICNVKFPVIQCEKKFTNEVNYSIIKYNNSA